MSHTITLTRTDAEGFKTMTIVRNDNEVRATYKVDGLVVNDDIAYDGSDAEGWLRDRLIAWEAEGYQKTGETDLQVNPNVKAAAIRLGNMPGNREAREAWMDAHQRMQLHGYCTCTVEEILSDKLCKAKDGRMLAGYLDPEIYN